ncbi:MAG: histidine phosphatase family protein [Phycisphaerae bacterium]|nr:histidine phosphatase family protein [Phycisphaerae bacterium]
MKVILIPCGTTEWRRDGRLLGRAALTLSEAGQQEALGWLDSLRPLGLTRIYHSPDDLATMTAKILAAALDIPTKSATELHEVDIGLWSGLTEAEFKRRYAKAHRQLLESPLNVSPPGGEELSEAAERVRAGLCKRLKKDAKETVGVVMRPFSFALARCALGELPPAGVWEGRQANGPIAIEFNAEAVVAANGRRDANA